MPKYLKAALSSVGLIVVVAFVVRVIFLVNLYQHYGITAVTNEVTFGAWGEAGSIAVAIASGRGFSSPVQAFHTGATAWLTPIFPYMLAAIFKLFGPYSYFSGLLVRFIDIGFAAFTCWPIYAIGKRSFGSTTGLIAAWCWAFCPTAIYFPVMWVWDTSMAGFLMAVLFAWTLRLRGSDKTSEWIGYGALWAFGAMVNASLVAVLPFIALWAIWPLRARLPQAAKLATLSALVFFVGIAPWTIRNYVIFHKFVPLRSNFGLEFWLGNNPEVYDSWSPLLHPNDGPAEGSKYTRMTEIPYMAQKQALALQFIRTHPQDFLRFTFRRFEENWTGIEDSPTDIWKASPLYVKFILGWTVSFSLLSLLGVLFAYRAGKPEATAFGLMLLIFPVLFYITHSALRYRYPLDPLMQVLSVYALVYPVSKLAAMWRPLPAIEHQPASGAD